MMADPRIPIKNPYLAAVLAYLLPGAGHLYQGRVFKAVLYFVCVMGTYLFGLYMSQWKVVYYRMDTGARNIAFFAQAGVGLFAIPAIVQDKRYTDQAKRLNENNRQNVNELLPISAVADELPIEAEFQGVWNGPGDAVRPIVGRVEIDVRAGDLGQDFRGRFTGHEIGEDGRPQPIEFELATPMEIGRVIQPGAGRNLRCDVVQTSENDEVLAGWIEGHIPRSFANHFAAPLNDSDLQNLNRDLGKYFELAKIFTWIAGLLNILAVWDALDGPAYGYGDEEESTDEMGGDSPGNSTSPEPAAAKNDSMNSVATTSPGAEKPVV